MLFRSGFVVGVQVSTFFSSFFHRGNRVVNIGFACTADVGEGYVAIVVGCVTAEQVRQVGLGCVQLLFSRSLTFGSEIRTAQGFVAQTADCAVYAVDADRFATVLSDFDGIGKF